MSETLRLLKHSPSVALLIMANNYHNLQLRSEYARVINPVAVDETTTTVTIETFDSKNDYIPNLYSGNLTFTYKRLRLEDIFGDMKLNLTPPLTVAGVVQNLSSCSGVEFTEDDYVNALVEGETFVLQSKPESLRWVGAVTIVLNPPGTVVPLSEAFSNNVLDGLSGVYADDQWPADRVITNPILDGLFYPIP